MCDESLTELDASPPGSLEGQLLEASSLIAEFGYEP